MEDTSTDLGTMRGKTASSSQSQDRSEQGTADLPGDAMFDDDITAVGEETQDSEAERDRQLLGLHHRNTPRGSGLASAGIVSPPAGEASYDSSDDEKEFQLALLHEGKRNSARQTANSSKKYTQTTTDKKKSHLAKITGTQAGKSMGPIDKFFTTKAANTRSQKITKERENSTCGTEHLPNGVDAVDDEIVLFKTPVGIPKLKQLQLKSPYVTRSNRKKNSSDAVKESVNDVGKPTRSVTPIPDPRLKELMQSSSGGSLVTPQMSPNLVQVTMKQAVKIPRKRKRSECQEVELATACQDVCGTDQDDPEYVQAVSRSAKKSLAGAIEAKAQRTRSRRSTDGGKSAAKRPMLSTEVEVSGVEGSQSGSQQGGKPSKRRRRDSSGNDKKVAQPAACQRKKRENIIDLKLEESRSSDDDLDGFSALDTLPTLFEERHDDVQPTRTAAAKGTSVLDKAIRFVYTYGSFCNSGIVGAQYKAAHGTQN